MVTKINPAQMGSLIHVTYYFLVGASDLAGMDKDNKGIDVKLKSAGFPTALWFNYLL